MDDLLVSNLERTVNVLLRRLAAVEALLARVSQTQWQVMGTPSIGSGGGAIQIANGSGIPAKTGGVLGSNAAYTLRTLDTSTGLLSAGSTITVWNDAPNAVVAGDIFVGQDQNGNYYCIAEFC